jgi:hypothetical protein
MIATQERPPTSWTEQGERLRASVTHVVDAVAGPLPRRLGTPTRQQPQQPPTLAAGRLAVRAGLWGVALGLLAPATTVLVQVSGLAAGGVQLVGSTDLGFFFGFVPLLAALVVTLLAFDHWPLHDLRGYHRDLAVGLLLVGVVTLVGLRAHGAAVTGDDWDDAWLFANGSLVLHVLVTWCLVRLAIDDLTTLHARRAGWRGPRNPAAGLARPGPEGAPAVAAGAPPAPPRTAPATGRGSIQMPTVAPGARPTPADAAGRPGPEDPALGRHRAGPADARRGGQGVGKAVLAWDAPRHVATLALAFRSIVTGVIVGTAAGAAAGTAVRPGLGTLAGGYLGAIYGLVPTAIGTAVLVTVVSWRRDTDPAAAERAVRTTLAAVGVGVLAAAWPFLHAAELPGAAALGSDPRRAWLLGAVVVVLLLRRAASALATAYVGLIPRATPA